ncbi:hypothetical protein LIER_28399 [Lithospermum erythrorhizon]|uniref:Uncharacterized protein n=1 Tax=Lithospermum erythrorhizon TaxID=34254 RepID=A0AAV3RFX9_LITER
MVSEDILWWSADLVLGTSIKGLYLLDTHCLPSVNAASQSSVSLISDSARLHPDLSFSVQTLCQFMQTPRSTHLEALNHLLRHVHSTMTHGIFIKGSTQLILQAFWILIGLLVPQQDAQGRISCHGHASAEVTWLVRLLHERRKHIEIDCYFTRGKVLEGLLHLAHLPTTEQIADILTKVLPSPQHHYLMSKLGLLPLKPPPACGGVGSFYINVAAWMMWHLVSYTVRARQLVEVS